MSRLIIARYIDVLVRLGYPVWRLHLLSCNVTPTAVTISTHHHCRVWSAWHIHFETYSIIKHITVSFQRRDTDTSCTTIKHIWRISQLRTNGRSTGAPQLDHPDRLIFVLHSSTYIAVCQLCDFWLTLCAVYGGQNFTQ